MRSLALALTLAIPASPAYETPPNFLPDQLVAWCIVPFDAKKRGPDERAQMVRDLGLRRIAYDWRAEHVEQFEQEILAYKRQQIEFFAFWGSHDLAFELFKKHQIHPQIWQTLHDPADAPPDQKVEAAAQALVPLATRTAEYGLSLGLYNHGGWGGQPQNLVAVCQRLHQLGHAHVGIVYNFHHGHAQIEGWPAHFDAMRPHLLCLNLNGMVADGDKDGRKILPFGQGDREQEMLRHVLESGYDGPVGILDHRMETDSAETLAENLKGLVSTLKHIALSPSLVRLPLDPAAHPGAQHPINRDRHYDFYARQALYFSRLDPAALPPILPPFPGLDGGHQGHWGNQNDEVTWKDARPREMDHGPAVAGVFRGADLTIPRAVSVQLGDSLHAVYNPESLDFELVWQGGFINFSDVRRGLLHGTPIGGTPVETEVTGHPAKGTFLGYYRHGSRIIFASQDGDTLTLDSLTAIDGSPSRIIEQADARRVIGAPDEARLAALLEGGPALYPQELTTHGELGDALPYAIDTLPLPHDNPWKALLFPSGIGFFPDGRIAFSTLHGDVWVGKPDGPELATITWRRHASGLHQPLGLMVIDGLVHVMGRDQLTALHDLDGDGEADFYQRISAAHQTSSGGHDYVTGLQRDSQGRWYFVSGNQGLCRISADGQQLEVLATGLRNPNGLAISPDGTTILTNVQEGDWTPASAICEAIPGGHFGAGGPRPGPLGYLPPLLYLPRGADNSCGGQAHIDSSSWGPVKDSWIHLSAGYGTHFLMLRDSVDGQPQAAALALPGEFLSGALRARFSPVDGQLYVAAAQGWGNYGTSDGALHRVRFTGQDQPYPYPIAWEARDNGVLLRFADPIPEALADPATWFAQAWNYIYGPAYGSPEMSPSQPDTPGHDPITITSAHRLEQGRTLFLEMPQLQPVHQLHLHADHSPRIELFATIHRLSPPFTGFPGYQKVEKTPLASSTTKLATPRKNPWAEGQAGRAITIKAAPGLQFEPRTFTVKAGERISLTFENPDNLPHNFLIAQPDSLRPLGEASNLLMADPAAVLSHYVPDSDRVLVWASLLPQGASETIHFTAPEAPGQYPYLCTFPGHWMVMNGIMTVE